MKNIKHIAQGFLLLALLVGVGATHNALADNNSSDSSNFISAQASLRADALANFESATGVMLGANNTLRVLNAKVSSVSNGDISASAPFGNSSLNFVIKSTADTKLNGKVLGSNAGSVYANLKSGDKVSFVGTIGSSTSSSITVNAVHVISSALYTGNVPPDKTSWKGEVKAINASDSSFTLDLKNGKTAKVVLASGAVVTVDGSVKALSDLKVGDDVEVTGTINSDGSVVTASKVTTITMKNVDDNGDKQNNGNHLGFWGRVRGWFR